jgi:hypothetical protein
MRSPLRAALIASLVVPMLGAAVAADDRVRGAPPARDPAFCLQYPAECEGDWMLERDRDAARRREQSEQQRRARGGDPTGGRQPDRPPEPPLTESQRYGIYCDSDPGACSGNYILDRGRLDVEDLRRQRDESRRKSDRIKYGR